MAEDAGAGRRRRPGTRPGRRGPVADKPGPVTDKPGPVTDKPGPVTDKPSFDLSDWDVGIPMLLVPIRLETKYATGAAGDELRIRIIPDPIAVRSAAPASERELAEGYDFWTAYLAAKTPEQRTATWRRFARRLGTNRAGYVARLVRPTVGPDRRPKFPPVTPESPTAGLVSLLPARWLATGWVGDAIAFQEFSDPVVGPVAVSPDPSATTSPISRSGLEIDPATAWLFDYDEALRRGMAITVPLTEQAAIAADGVSRLLVVGIDDAQQPAAVAAELSALFEQHVCSSGLAFVPQGTPTNNTATVASGYTREEAELADLEQRELGPYEPDVDDNASRLSRALGLTDVETLGRIAHGVDLEHARSRDMRIALFETVLGTYVRDLLATHTIDGTSLTDRMDPDTIAALRSWFVTWVTGGAPVPTIRVGAQPYGVLPVMPESSGSPPVGVAGHIADFVDELIGEWRYAVAAVPVLDHDATDVLGATPEEADAVARELVARVLANNPHPRRIALRGASDWSDQPRPEAPAPLTRAAGLQRVASEQPLGSDTWSRPLLLPLVGGYRWEYEHAIEELETTYATTVKWLYDLVLHEIVPAGPVLDDDVVTGPAGGGFPPPTPRVAGPASIPSAEDDIRGIEQQIEVWSQIDALIDDREATHVDFGPLKPEMHEFTQGVIEQLERHELRQRPLRWLDLPGLDGVLGRDDLQLLLTKFSTLERIWQRAVVQDDAAAAPGMAAAAYLRYLSRKAWNESTREGPTGGLDNDPLDLPDGSPFELPGPILELPPEFLETAPLLFQLVDATLSNAGDRPELSAALARLATVDPVELDWLVRECLGLGANRLDAWHTSRASERLSTLRDKTPTGVHVGCYGFALDLARSDARASHGFIHAPSLAHAGSAAVLRSGWLARGNGRADSPAAIDLSSARVRSADWLLSGVRHGQDLGDLLGASFERALHDARLDVAIRPLRQAVVDADGLKPSAVDLPIDGIRLLELHRAGALDDTVTALALGARDQRQLNDRLRGLEAAFDAVDDVTTFESVHQLVVGNLERAAAVLDGAGPNGGRPPELNGVRIPRGAVTIDVRTLVLIDASSGTTAWPDGTRDQFDPALNAWVASMLPLPSEVGWTATDAAGEVVEFELDDLPLSALDACILASDDPTTLTPGLRRLTELARPDRALVAVDPTHRGRAPISLTEFQLLAIELKRLIQESTPADGRSVALSDEVIGVDALGAVPKHATDGLDELLGDFASVATATSWADLGADVAASLARLGLVPSPTVEASADFVAVQAHLARRRKVANAVENPTTLAGTRDRVAALMGTAAPLLAPFVLPTDGGVVLSPALAAADELDDWLDVAATVHPSVGHLGRAIDLSGFLGLAPPTLIAGHGPLVDGDRWAATHRPAAGTGGRVAAAVVAHGPVAPGREVVGLVVDRWSERIPNPDQVTGVAFHFDAPSCEAPQTMLLVVPPAGATWSTSLVQDSVLETIEWMQLRAVAIDDLGDYGHAVPTTFVPGYLDGTATVGVAT
jgi:hypothetical protein